MTETRYRIAGSTLYWISRMVRGTCRFQISGMENMQAAITSERPLIFATWHGSTMMLVGLLADLIDPGRFMLLMPDDWRGGALKVFTEKLGANPFPVNLKGDTTLATARRLLSLVRLIKDGKYGYITPDGPDGPSYVIKPGTTYIAQKAGALIVPLGAHARNAYRLNRWDHYAIPYPFSRISIYIGPGLAVERKAELTAVTEQLTDMLHRTAARATGNYYAPDNAPN